MDLSLSTANAIPFVMVDATNTELAGLGATLTVAVSKNGGAFAPAAGVQTELTGGWYLYTTTVAECNTAGLLALRITGAGALQQNLVYTVGSTTADVWTSATRTLTSTAAATVAAVNGSELAITQGVTFAATLSGLTISALWTKCYLTLKRAKTHTDAQAVLQLVVSNPAAAATDGALYVEGAAATVAQRTQAGLTVTQAAGTVAIVVQDDLTDNLGAGAGIYYDVKTLLSDGSSVQNTTGMLRIIPSVTLTV